MDTSNLLDPLDKEAARKFIAERLGFQTISIPSLYVGRFGFGDYEADLCYITPDNYLNEVDIITSLSELEKEIEKKRPHIRQYYFAFHREFYKAANLDIYKLLKKVQSEVGIMILNPMTMNLVVQKAKERDDIPPLTPIEMKSLIHLAASKWWC